MPAPDNGASAKLATAIGPGGSNLIVSLYSNLVNVTEATTAADLTPAHFDGYSAQQRDDWSAPAANSAGIAVSYSKPFTWTAGANRALDHTVYGWRATLKGPDGDQTLAIRPLAPPAPVVRKGQTLELSFAVYVLIFDPASNDAIIAIDQQVILRGQRIKPSFRGRLKGLRKALRGVWAEDGHASDRQERTGQGQYFFMAQEEVSRAAYDVAVRLDELLAVPHLVRADVPLDIRDNLIGVLPGKD